MSTFFSNVWTKRVVSLLSPLYAGVVFLLAYASIFYQLEILRPVQTCLLMTAVSLFALIIMLYTREQFLTKCTSLVLLPGLLLPLLLFFGQWSLLLPPLIASLIIFFFSGLGETTKTIWGTIFLLIYFIGALIYFLANSLFAPSTVSEVTQSGDSPSGIYRYTVTQTEDSSDGSTKVTVETNVLDKDLDILRFRIRGLSRDVHMERPLNPNIEITWQTETREQVVQELLGISPEADLALSDDQMTLLARPAYRLTYADGTVKELSPEAYYLESVTLTAEEMTALYTERSEWLVSELSEDALATVGITVEDLKTVKVNSLTSEELDRLGVPKEGDVMYCNGQVIFRYYVAVLEEYFDISKQDLGLF